MDDSCRCYCILSAYELLYLQRNSSQFVVPSYNYCTNMKQVLVGRYCTKDRRLKAKGRLKEVKVKNDDGQESRGLSRRGGGSRAN